MKNIKFLFIFLFIGTLFITPLNVALADDFADLMGDVPLMPNLVEDLDQRLVFDKAGGRIVETMTHGTISQKEVQDFYEQTLPEIGWQFVSLNEMDRELIFSKETEILEIKFSTIQNGLGVKFSLYPSPN